MLIQIATMLLGFVCLWKGGDFLVDGASAVAKRFGLSSFIIGLTVVAFGTSAPELAVNVIASLKGQSDITFGNILGSNLSNILLILGITSIIYPIVLHDKHIKADIPISIACVGAMLGLLYWPGKTSLTLHASDGLILLFLFTGFMIYVAKSKKDSQDPDPSSDTAPLLQNIALTLLGIVLLPLGGKWVTEPAIFIAQTVGLSEIFISLFTIAIGTSLPELATSVNAALKKETDIAIGNIIGSNIFNILLIVGISSLVAPLHFNPILLFECLIIAISSFFIILFVRMYRPFQLKQWHGIIFLAAYIAYAAMAYLRG